MTLLQRTRQVWKLYVFVTLMALGAGITLLQSFLYRFLEKETITYLVIGGMILVIGVFAWAYASITCPNCKLKLFWHSITKEGLGTWFTWLVNLETCPHCENRDGRPASPPGQGKSRSGSGRQRTR